ncbi:MAG: D-2-hydroxyacid dehydrogenase [Bacteroidota bacterium]
MKRILANDGINVEGKKALEDAGFEVTTEKVAQEDLVKELKNYDVVLVRSATKIRKDIIDACPNLKLIGRGGVGLDNIDVEYAKSKGIKVINTPAASSQSVAELVFAHLFTMVRFLHDSNRNMPLTGDKEFKVLKKKYAKGMELKGKTLGILGLGRIGQAAAKIALGLGMKVVATDPHVPEATIEMEFFTSDEDTKKISIKIKTVSFEKVLKDSDFITLHLPMPADGKPLITKKEIEMMKDGVIIVNAARGGVVNEADLFEALNSGKVALAGIDVFENEPTPPITLLMQHNVSLSPHIGAATNEAQQRIGLELAEKIIDFFG